MNLYLHCLEEGLAHGKCAITFFFFIWDEDLPQKGCVHISVYKHLTFHSYHRPFLNLEGKKMTARRQGVT